ncbi:F5/8 type C domain-containing protein [Amphibacillus marinus]|uniref:F5/8 type C domain-containing protein n=1 Tax=Amphibacillus marinus TaxID=872970 RepID=A0A1H8H2R6_9BACI|nr:discoidin domain-containing protein [Amphibacillus marinus]SEN50425.1 F5/8 type C domain-containing protein [Amphibacillus marinus]
MTKISLAGIWNYRFDLEDQGLDQSWYQDMFLNHAFQLPGTTSTNKVGQPVDPAKFKQLTKASVTTHQERYPYLGVLWLQKQMTVDVQFAPDQDVILNFERILGQSTVWINETMLGSQNSLSTPHYYVVSPSLIKRGEPLTITVRIDNRVHQHLGELASGYSLHTQGLWAGIVGELTLAQAPINCQLFYDQAKQLLEVVVATGKQPVQVVICDQAKNRYIAEPDSYEYQAETTHYQFDVSKLDIWYAAKPNHYQVQISMGKHTIYKTFGRLDLSADTNYIYQANKRLFLRGTLDCAIFPKTGYPTMDQEGWQVIFTKIKGHGLNHVRFHSWCPPKAAFLAADYLGLYLMVEAPIWLDEWFNNKVGDAREHYAFITNEVSRILASYGHHPSFSFFSIGNELAGDFKFLAELIQELPFKEHQILTTITANTTNRKRTFYERADHFFIGVEYQGKGLRGNRFLDQMVEGTALDYQMAAEHVPLPVITHEIGQYASYPVLDVIEKYDGAMVPTNLLSIQHDLREKQLTPFADQYVTASLKLARDLYKAEIEAVQRSNAVSGYQLLGLQDYPGQNTATVGLLDSFWQDKQAGLTDMMKEFCNDVVPIIELERRIFLKQETISCRLAVRNDLFESLNQARVTMTITHDQTVLFQDQFTATLNQGNYQVIKELSVSIMAQLNNDAYLSMCTLELCIEANKQSYCNHWQIWVADQSTFCHGHTRLFVDDWASPALEAALERGERCLLQVNPTLTKNVKAGHFFPVFWSPVFFDSKDDCGVSIANQHPLFQTFETDDYGSFQWKSLLEGGCSFATHQLTSIISPVPNFYNHDQRSYLLEVKVGTGKLMISGFDIDRGQKPEEQAFRSALLDYLDSDAFEPIQQLDWQAVKQLIPSDQDHAVTQGLSSDLAYRKPAWADIERSTQLSADRGNDGIHDTYWTTPAQTDGHWWCVDLGQTAHFEQIVIYPLDGEETTLTITVSEDGEYWSKHADSTKPGLEHVINKQGYGRFVKIHYHHPLNIAAGQISCQVFQQRVR